MGWGGGNVVGEVGGGWGGGGTTHPSVQQRGVDTLQARQVLQGVQALLTNTHSKT
jgi:hypothetical protein